MKGKRLEQFERELKQLGFKKVYFDDRSGYWFVKNMKMRGLTGRFYLEPDNDLFVVEVMTYNYTNKTLKKRWLEIVAKLKCNLPTVKNAIKTYK